jgi:predicted Fe-Mo cluster-binding NifX family protein
MKIAVATEDGKVISSHFGRSPYFAIYQIEDGKIIHKEMRKNTFTAHFRNDHSEHHDHKHELREEHHHKHHHVAEGLKDCNVVISHGMGRRAWEDLRAKGIQMIVTDETDVEQSLNLYRSGKLEDRTEMLH